MADKLKDYQVLDVFCGGTFYKVKHKVTNNIFAWKAYNCYEFSSDHIQKVAGEVKILSKLLSGSLLRYYDTILHGPTKTLYFVLEYVPWQNLQELIETCKAENKYFSENYIWFLILELARACKEIENLNLVTLQKCITPGSIFVGANGELRINCFDLDILDSHPKDLMKQVGILIRTLCNISENTMHKIQELIYSDDLMGVVSFITEERSTILRPDVVLYHPTVLTNTESLIVPKHIDDILVQFSYTSSEVNKCDSEKAVDMCKDLKPLPRTHLLEDSPIYCNVVPRRQIHLTSHETPQKEAKTESPSPTIAALALELPGYVPRSRRPYSEAVTCYEPKKVSEDTLSHQWMSRLIALRQREESLNQRERELIAKEIKNSPSAKVICYEQSPMCKDSNGITLPPEICQINDEKKQWVSRRRHRRTSSVRSRSRRKSYSYEDLDSSLSADNGDSSMVVTAAKITQKNMPRNLFPDASKKVHFTPINPFVESDESVTLTFYELDNVDKEGYLAPRDLKDIAKFKYLNVEKTSEKRNLDWNHSSPNKQAKINDIFSDITNKSNLRKTPSKSSITSKCSNISRCSIISSKSQWSTDSKVGDSAFERTKSMRQTDQTPLATPGHKKTKRKSLLPFKTPFKFMSTHTKV